MKIWILTEEWEISLLTEAWNRFPLQFKNQNAPQGYNTNCERSQGLVEINISLFSKPIEATMKRVPLPLVPQTPSHDKTFPWEWITHLPETRSSLPAQCGRAHVCHTGENVGGSRAHHSHKHNMFPLFTWKTQVLTPHVTVCWVVVASRCTCVLRVLNNTYEVPLYLS